MKRLVMALFLFALCFSLSAIAQDAGQQQSGSTDQMGSSSQKTDQGTMGDKKGAGKLRHLKGKISDDGKSFTTDKDNKTYTIVNPDAVKGHEGLDVRLSGHVDEANNSVHVMSVKMGKETAKKDKDKGMSEKPPMSEQPQ